LGWIAVLPNEPIPCFYFTHRCPSARRWQWSIERKRFPNARPRRNNHHLPRLQTGSDLIKIVKSGHQPFRGSAFLDLNEAIHRRVNSLRYAPSLSGISVNNAVKMSLRFTMCLLRISRFGKVLGG